MSPRFSPSELFLKAQTDERLVALAADGHGRAFAVLIERHRRPLIAHARRLVGAEREEDVVQQALLRAWTALERGAEVRHVQAWLHRIVHNAALTEIERQVPPAEPLSEQLVDPRSADAAAEQRLQVREVLLGVSALPERQRLALLGTELEGRSRRQLAAELGLSEGAIRQLVHRARDGVRAAMAAFIPFPLIIRAMRASGWLSGSGASAALRPAGETAAASGLATGVIIKAGAAVLAVGAVGGLVLHAGHGHRHARRGAPHHLTARQSAHATGPIPVRHASVVDTAMRSRPAVVHAVVARRPAAPSVARPSSPAGGLAPAIPQPQTSVAPAGAHHATGDSTPGRSRDSSGTGADRSRSGTTGASSGGSSADNHPSKDSTGSAGTDHSSSPASSSDTGSSSASSSDATSPSGSSLTATSPSGSSPDATNASAGSDSSAAQSTTTSSSTTTTSTTPSGGD